MMIDEHITYTINTHQMESYRSQEPAHLTIQQEPELTCQVPEETPVIFFFRKGLTVTAL